MLDPAERFVELDTPAPLSPLPVPPLLLPLLRPSDKHSDESLDDALATAFEPQTMAPLSFAIVASFKSDER